MLVVVLTGGFLLIQGAEAARGALFGGVIALANTMLLGLRSRQADSGRALDARDSLKLLVRCALERYMAVAALFLLGLLVFKLAAGPMLIGFAVALLALPGLGRTSRG